MAQQVVELTCPGCGARLATGQINCDWCHKPVNITTFQSGYDMPVPIVSKYANEYNKALATDQNDKELNASVGMCYLKLKQYEKAGIAFEKAIEDNFDNSELFFFAAICILNGKRPFQCPKKNIDKAIGLLDSACMIEPRGIYYYLQAYLAYDYYSLKQLRCNPGPEEYLNRARQAGIPGMDLSLLKDILGQEFPAALAI